MLRVTLLLQNRIASRKRFGICGLFDGLKKNFPRCQIPCNQSDFYDVGAVNAEGKTEYLG